MLVTLVYSTAPALRTSLTGSLNLCLWGRTTALVQQATGGIRYGTGHVVEDVHSYFHAQVLNHT